MKKIIVIGLGSIGQRHARNVKALRPAVDLVYCDPCIDAMPVNMPYTPYKYFDFQSASNEHSDADGVIIASPTERHSAQLGALMVRRIPTYVEKPLVGLSDWRPTTREALLHYAAGTHFAVGYQYRFCEWLPKVARSATLKFYARDNLIDRYGPTVLETMGSHAIDRALYALGAARDVALFTDGRYFMGSVTHERGLSEYDMRIDAGPRTSTINGEPNDIDNDVYLDALGAWLKWIETGERDQRLATLADGVAVMDVMAACKMIETEKA